MAETTKGVPYPVAGDAPDGPAQLLALAQWIDAVPGVAPLTTAQRDALSGGARWVGRLIHNLTLGRLQRWNGTGWEDPESAPVLQGYRETVAAAASVSGSRTYGSGTNVHAETLVGDVTATVDVPYGGTVAVWLLQDGTGGREVTWAAASGSTLAWPDGAVPTDVDLSADTISLFVFTRPFPAIIIGTLALTGVA